MTNLDKLVDRVNRASSELGSYNIVTLGGPNDSGYVVVHGGKAYNVEVDKENHKVMSCGCPDCVYRNITCKHMIAVSRACDIDVALM